MVRKEKPKSEAKAFLAVRMRGSYGVRWKTERTLEQLRLLRRHHAAVFKATTAFTGMLREAGNYIAWGPAQADVLEAMLSKRGEVTGGKRLDAAYLAKNSKFKTLAELAGALAKGEASLKDVNGLKPVFRLQPPKGGRAPVKKAGERFNVIGFQGVKVNALVQRML
jgi:large subunit ribosomal protein L30